MSTLSIEIEPQKIDADAVKIVRRLKRHGHEAYLVGGCVRDLLLGCTPKDFDVATSATPNEIRDLFRNSRIIGRRFRLVHIFFGRKIIETSTFRQKPPAAPETDDEDTDDDALLIRRDNVWGTALDDALRRDFTLNGLFYDPVRGEVIDFLDVHLWGGYIWPTFNVGDSAIVIGVGLLIVEILQTGREDEELPDASANSGESSG